MEKTIGQYLTNAEGALSHFKIALKKDASFPMKVVEDLDPASKKEMYSLINKKHVVEQRVINGESTSVVVLTKDVNRGATKAFALRPGATVRTLDSDGDPEEEEEKIEDIPPTKVDGLAAARESTLSAQEASLHETLTLDCADANKALGATYLDCVEAIRCLVEKAGVEPRAILTICLYSTVMNRDTIGERFGNTMKQIVELPEVIRDWMHKGMVMIGDLMWHHYGSYDNKSGGFARLYSVYMKKVPGGAAEFDKDKVEKKEVAKIVSERVRNFKPAGDNNLMDAAWRMLAPSKNAAESLGKQNLVAAGRWVKKSGK